MSDSDEKETSTTTPDLKQKYQQQELFELEELAEKIYREKTLADAVPKIVDVAQNEPILKLTRQQELNIAKISYILDQTNRIYTPDAIFDYWPTTKKLAHRAGPRPTLLQIQRWMKGKKYESDLANLGMKKDQDSGSLTAEQIVALNFLTDTSSTKSFQARLKELSIPPVKYRAWMRQKEFNTAIRKIASTALTDAIPMAEIQLAARAEEGDLKTIKYLFEVTGRHDPARQQQVDTQALIGVIIDTVQEVFGNDPDKLRQFASLVKTRSIGVKGVIQQ